MIKTETIPKKFEIVCSLFYFIDLIGAKTVAAGFAFRKEHSFLLEQHERKIHFCGERPQKLVGGAVPVESVAPGTEIDDYLLYL
ncbi:hypothetical protein JOD29_000026 [Lysinibacillus composti]|uniref:Uncharacterized protein n=1 Tax=Lysinibacillus composti TaxID=720633 RepID=A0A3N9UMX7_9BACI|nr:hypothetical protein [Lysinibacillus composti]MBM7606789.1 hypothetical protein [Lysinibacillus composti]RQW76598.1 hypothetical protein EBB45_03340 [Lysinibacillus composti]